MSESGWVVNASPLILLGKVAHLDTLLSLSGDVEIPEAVKHEVQRKDSSGFWEDWCNSNHKIRVHEAVFVPAEVQIWNLGFGETQVIALALQLGCTRVVLDDLAARRCATTFRLEVVGTLGVIGLAKQQGILSQARPVIEQLLQVGLYASEALVEGFLKQLGE